MKRLIFILILFSCSKPDTTICEPTEPLVCVDCFDQLTHLSFLDVFCGTEQEAESFILRAKELGKEKGLILYCIKK